MASHKATHGQDEKVISGKPPSVSEGDYLKEYDIPARPRGTEMDQPLPSEKGHSEPVLDDKETAARIGDASRQGDDNNPNDNPNPVKAAGGNFEQRLSDKEQDDQVDLSAQQTALGPNVSSNDE
ncbi:hypothetical protein KFL_001110160 [Klebsormidium nitens]|uniref:Uncharacterized protein n=1 Tax=Klebsormidium nitens TaxID=105231 RepID=A0A1Y1HUY5_KLENI|nr:hypothetical protein KFL_001110160 [Klebsormidium nitens]|eukprot:GAQ82440.1 hypothetical protein KFL_001110160 [Klebsormidium nitens]